MKSFEKFQYDTSPYEIDEEVEELDEDLVGMVKKGITATGNVLDKGSEQLKKVGTAVGNRVGAVKSSISQSLQKGGVVPKPADRLPSTRRYKPGERTEKVTNSKGEKKEKVNYKRTGSPNRENLATQKSKPSQTPIKRGGNLVRKIADTSGTTKQFPGLVDKKNYQGGIRSAAVRNVASIGNQIRKGLTAKPDQKISYDAKGSGFGGPTMGVGKNIQQAASNVGDAKLYKPTRVDSVTGKVKKGKVDQTVKDRFGLTNLVNTGKDDTSKSGAEKVTQSGATVSAKQSKKERKRAKREAERKKNLVTQGKGVENVVKAASNQSEKDAARDAMADMQSSSDKKFSRVTPENEKIYNKTQQTSNPGATKSNTKSNTDSQGRRTLDSMNPDEKARRGIGGGSTGGGSTEGSGGANTNNTDAFDREGNPVSRFGKKQPFITYNKNNKNNKKSGKVTGNYKDDKGNYTHWADIPDEKQYSSKTPKLFEQFLFEIETRSTKKKKDGRGMHPHNEIKPMSGTNTITINPEDETSKYKRGY